MLFKVLSFAVTLMFLGGCASGAAEFTCGQFPESGCQPVSEAYNATNGDLDEYDYRGQLFREDDSEILQAHTNSFKNALPTIQIGNTARSLNYVVAGDSIFSNPKILRVLITEWEDIDQDLHGGGFVYLVIEEGQWLLKN
jgi:hypothetical protein